MTNKRLYPKYTATAKKGILEEESRYLRFSTISFLIFFLLGVPMLAFLIMKYYGKDPYGDFAGLLLLLGIIGFIGVLLVSEGKVFKFQNYYLRNSDMFLIFILYIVGLLAILGFIWYILGSTLRYALSMTELYFYYIGAAIMEEMFFRFFLCGISKNYLIELRNKGRNKIPESIENLLISIITALVFMLSHWSVYGNSLIGITAMFFGGIMFGMFYLHSKDISITMIAHIWVNIIAVGNLLMISGGA